MLYKNILIYYILICYLIVPGSPTSYYLYTRQHLEIETGKTFEACSSFIEKEFAEDRRSCHQVPVASTSVITLLMFRNM